MKLAHTITISVFVKKEEDEQKIKEAILKLVPFDLEKEKISLNKTVAEGFSDKITIYELNLEKERHTTKEIDLLKNKLGQEQIKILASQENRVDDECVFYMRLDKNRLLEDKCVITDSGECFHIKMTIAAFPKKREEAIKVVKQIFRC
jgi:hypothetical protein